jgi:hypothetical protein
LRKHNVPRSKPQASSDSQDKTILLTSAKWHKGDFMENKGNLSEVELLCEGIHSIYDLAQKARAIQYIKREQYLGTTQPCKDECKPTAGAFNIAHSKLSEIDEILHEIICYLKCI